MNAISPIEAVTFDAAGTLIHLTESVGESYSRVARRFEITASPEALDLAFRVAWKRAPAPFTNQQGTFGEATLLDRENDFEKSWWRDLVRGVFDDAGSGDSPRFDDFFEALYDHFEAPGCWALDSAAVAMLDLCENQGFKIGLLSNFDYRLRRILTDLGIFFTFRGRGSVGRNPCVKAGPADVRDDSAENGNCRCWDHVARR